MNLKGKVNSYYQACGYDTHPVADFPRIILARRQGVEGASELIIAWVEDDVPEAVDRSKELKTAAQMTELPNRYLRATLWFICPLVEGLSNDFRRDIRFLGFNIREEALFFVAEFKAENNPGAIDIAKALQKLAAEARPLRVSQPFQILE